MPTGEVEVELVQLECLNEAKNVAFFPTGGQLPNEEVRLRNRFLDLRRPQLQHNLRVRSSIMLAVRNHLAKLGFMEVETPVLFKSTAEGAREFLVPTRQRGKMYALPQSPQQYKQILMASAVDKYFQIAKCFRDEDLRADRQPEFTQLDLEMAFVDMEQIRAVVEGIVAEIFEACGLVLDVGHGNLPRMSYHDALNTYGSDKPDTRFGLQIQQLPVQGSDDVYDVLVLRDDQSRLSRTKTASVAKAQAEDVLVFKVGTELPAVLRDHVHPTRLQQLQMKSGDLVLVHRRPPITSEASTIMGRVRLQLATALEAQGMLPPYADKHSFVWIDGFPLFTLDSADSAMTKEERVAKAGHAAFTATHHPFTAPLEQDKHLLYSHPERVRAQHYDLVLNGVEVGGGSIRIHDGDMQRHVLHDILQLSQEEMAQFSHLLRALDSGCPPHGGIALGMDRLIAVLCKADSIRDVIAFPKASNGLDLMVNSPDTVAAARLQEYGITIQ